jgi:hypothetical protein
LREEHKLQLSENTKISRSEIRGMQYVGNSGCCMMMMMMMMIFVVYTGHLHLMYCVSEIKNLMD